MPTDPLTRKQRIGLEEFWQPRSADLSKKTKCFSFLAYEGQRYALTSEIPECLHVSFVNRGFRCKELPRGRLLG